ncbi:MAG: VOC family protein [Myxococcales bacterium]|nr:VOC family protein [Myxococcales bacterium]
MSEASLLMAILAVEDLERALRFYRGAFGFVARIETPVFVELALPGGPGLGLYERVGFGRNTGQLPALTPPASTSATELYFRVSDLERSIDRLEALGAPCLSPRAPRPWGDVAAYYRDPDGNVVAIAIPNPEAAS